MSAHQMRRPIAERFIEDDDAFIQDARYQGRIARSEGMMLEVEFPDGGVAHCEYGQWAVGPLGSSQEPQS
jgi:hypothetical protein